MLVPFLIALLFRPLYHLSGDTVCSALRDSTLCSSYVTTGTWDRRTTEYRSIGVLEVSLGSMLITIDKVLTHCLECVMLYLYL